MKDWGHVTSPQIACLEEIAFEQGFVTADKARACGEAMRKPAEGYAILNAVKGR